MEHAVDCGTLLLGGRVCRRRQIISIPRGAGSEHVVLERTVRAVVSNRIGAWVGWESARVV